MLRIFTKTLAAVKGTFSSMHPKIIVLEDNIVACHRTEQKQCQMSSINQSWSSNTTKFHKFTSSQPWHIFWTSRPSFSLPHKSDVYGLHCKQLSGFNSFTERCLTAFCSFFCFARSYIREQKTRSQWQEFCSLRRNRIECSAKALTRLSYFSAFHECQQRFYGCLHLELQQRQKTPPVLT